MIGRCMPTGSTSGQPTSRPEGINERSFIGNRGLTAKAWAEDGTIEAFEADGGDQFLVAVQWHPEAGDDPSLFRALVAAARDHALEAAR